MNVPAPPETRLLRLDDVVEATTLSKSLIYALMKAGEFVPAIRLSKNRIAFSADSIREWVNSRTHTNASAGEAE